jgi:hypothetical protein
MTLRNGHGALRPEVLRPDELPAPMAADAPDLSGVTRRQNGTVDGPTAARALGSIGGHQKAKGVALARSLGLPPATETTAFTSYRRSASHFRRYHCAELAKMAGGHCGAAPSSMVASAALQLAASRFLFDQGARTGDAATLKTASQLANDSRQNLLAAYELAQREAQARPPSPSDFPWFTPSPKPKPEPIPAKPEKETDE